MQVMSFTGGLVLAMLADRREAASAGLLATWWGLGGLLVLALMFFGGHAVNLACVAAAGFLILGTQHVLNNFTACTYDTTVRASGVGMELGVGRAGAILGPFVAGLLQGGRAAPDLMFAIIGGAALIAAAAIASLWRMRGETAGSGPAIMPPTGTSLYRYSGRRIEQRTRGCIAATVPPSVMRPGVGPERGLVPMTTDLGRGEPHLVRRGCESLVRKCVRRRRLYDDDRVVGRLMTLVAAQREALIGGDERAFVLGLGCRFDGGKLGLCERCQPLRNRMTLIQGHGLGEAAERAG
jgi:hypothetical protein